MGILFEYIFTLYFLFVSSRAVKRPITPDPITAQEFSGFLDEFYSKLIILTADPYDQDTPEPPCP